ncbi:MAG TPA: spore germination protein [Bacillus sp. (in: firmicutes)]|uniref:spore germination protein n=1 Tax=Bacillus litorisediminis TaxID=2922713 RepID=UPI001FAEB015|nr:spore germination protein [Bacillus litorisediminis]HWO77566.1 spore germination protein [Bacillus sp. (in: firmicutes)]
MPPFFKRSKRKKTRPNEETDKNQSIDPLIESIDDSLTVNLDYIRKRTGNSPDVVIRQFKIGKDLEVPIAIVYLEGLSDHTTINDFLIESIMQSKTLQNELTLQDAFDIMKEQVIALGTVKEVLDWDNLFSTLMTGQAIILMDGKSSALSASTKGGEKRSIEEPSSQVTIRGPRDGFTESIQVNIALVRKRIHNPDLWVETMNIGKITKTTVSIMYINGIAKKKIVEEVRTRLNRINIDSILESGYIEQLIEDQTFTTFPTTYHTERPDTVAGNLLEGRIAIFVDGTPFVLIVPALFIQFFQSVEDYYGRFDISTFLRFLRILMFFISVIAPAVYIAATTFHQEMIPTPLLIAIAAQREAVPFPAFVEALIMEIAFEILREAGIRMPRAVGSAISVVGALVVGQAAVEAGIVSAAMVIIVAITAIANFATPSIAMAISARLIRFLFMVAAATFGFYGIILGIIIQVVHLCSLRSFGVPYMAPLAPMILSDNDDTIVRVPWWAFRTRPKLLTGENQIREGKNQKPEPPANQGMVNKDTDKDKGGQQ